MEHYNNPNKECQTPEEKMVWKVTRQIQNRTKAQIALKLKKYFKLATICEILEINHVSRLIEMINMLTDKGGEK